MNYEQPTKVEQVPGQDREIRYYADGTQSAVWMPVGYYTNPSNNQSQFSNTTNTNIVQDSGRENVNANVNDLTGQLNDLSATDQAYQQAQQAYQNVNKTTSDDEEAIRKAGVSAGQQYDPLISEAEFQKGQGMGRSTISAGEAGGFMSTQFAGLSALQQTEGRTWAGRGGQLEEVKSAYDRNISNLQSQKNTAIAQAEQAMRDYIRTGKQAEFENAQQMYNLARAKATEEWDLLSKKTQALSQAAMAPYQLQKMIADANRAQTEAAQASVGAHYDYITSQLTGNPEEDAAIIEQASMELGLPPSMVYSSISALGMARQKEQLLNAANLVDILQNTQKGGTVNIPGVGNVEIAGTDVTGKPTILEGNNTAYQYVNGKWVDLGINPKAMTPDKIMNILSDMSDMSPAQQAMFNNAVSGIGGLGNWSNLAEAIGGMRTDRHNNPTAMTTEAARTLGLVEGIDYIKGDAFPDNPNLFTARLAGDGWETTIKALDMAAKDPNKQAFYTQSGGQRWSYFAMSDNSWLALSDAGKLDIVKQMYQREGGSGTLIGDDRSALKVWDEWEARQAVLSVLPTQMKNSDEEKRTIFEGVDAGMEVGLTPFEIADVAMGYIIDNDKKDKFAENVRHLISQSNHIDDNDIASIARLINNGRKGQVIQKIESKVTKDTDAQIREEAVRFIHPLAIELVKDIQKMESKFGIVAGNWGKLTKKVISSPEFQSISSRLTALTQDWKTKTLGISVSKTELKMVKELMASVTDNPRNAMVKIKEFTEYQMDLLNASRGTVNLEPLDYQTLMDFNVRAQLYDYNNWIEVQLEDGSIGSIPPYQFNDKIMTRIK